MPLLSAADLREASRARRGSGTTPCGRGHAASARTSGTGVSVLRSGVIDHPLKIHHDCGLVADDPGVVAGGQQRDVARMAFQFGAVVHFDHRHAGHRLTARERAAGRFQRAGSGMNSVSPAIEPKRFRAATSL